MTAAAQSTAARNSTPAPRRRWLIALGCVLALLVVPVVGYLYLAWAERREVQAAITEIEQLDRRWRLDELLADRQPIPDAENPAVIVEQVIALLEPGTFDIGQENDRFFDNLPSVRQLNEPQIKALRASLTKHEGAVKLARTLKQFPGEGRLAMQWGSDICSANLDPVMRCRGVLSMLQYDAMLRAEDGDAHGALESSQALLVATRAIGVEPSLIVALVRFAGEAAFVYALERTLAQGQQPAERLKAVQDLLATEIDATFVLEAMRGERGGSDATVARLQRGDTELSRVFGQPKGNRSFEDMLVDTIPAIALRGRPEFLRLMNRAVEAAKLPPEKQGAAFAELDNAVHTSNATVVRLFAPALGTTSRASRRMQAKLRCSLVGLAAERYRLHQSRWPATLEDLRTDGLLAAVPLDPFDGQPLRCKILADGMVVYSVGDDGVDNGGAINWENPSAWGTDLGFRLWNVGARRQPPLPVPPPDNDVVRDNGIQ